MKKVITYGTYDLLHYGHIRLLERAKKLGDYLIVGVTSDDFDKKRGKINVQQSLMERIQNVKETGLADEIIVEEYEGQKIDDIIAYGVDIFTVGSDWEGKFDYLNEYCQVKYLSRTEGVSSSEIRTEKRRIRLGLVGKVENIKKIATESNFVNGIEVVGICTDDLKDIDTLNSNLEFVTNDYNELLEKVDAVYLISHPSLHYEQILKALNSNKHVLCESPIALSKNECKKAYALAKEKKLILMDSQKTAYTTAYTRLLLLLKGGIIGDIVSIDSTCTSLEKMNNISNEDLPNQWNSICAWGPTAMLPIFQLLGTKYTKKSINSLYLNKELKFDAFTKIDFLYKNAVASIKVGKCVKSEGELIVTGTKGYVYVPSPWWKTDYFEIRYENFKENKRYYYQLEGEGYRYELVSFVKAITTNRLSQKITEDVSSEICNVIEHFYKEEDLMILGK